MNRRANIILAAIALVIVGSLVASYCRANPRHAPAESAPPAQPSAAQLALGRAVAAWVIESGDYRRRIDSLTRASQRWQREAGVLRRERAVADSAAAQGERQIAAALPRVPPPLREPLAAGVAAILAAGTACRASLVNCETRAANAEARDSLTRAQLGRVQTRAVVVVVAALGLAVAAWVTR